MKSRRGSILLVVFGIIVLTSLAAATLLRRSMSASWAAVGADRRLAPRLAAWSGIEAIMGELASQRPQLLGSTPPRLTERIVITDAEQPLVVRLIPLDGRTAASECGKIDLNRAPVDWLGRVPGLSSDLGFRIDTARCTHAVGSAEELQRLGIDPDSLVFDAAPTNLDAPATLASLVGVFSADTPESTLDTSVAAPICLCEPLSETDAQLINSLAGADLSTLIKARQDAGPPITTRAALARLATSAAIDPKHIGEVLDRVCFTRDPVIYGRIDLNTAPPGVIAVLPGMSMTTAERIVRARDLTPDQDRRNLLWPVIAGAVELDAFTECLDLVSVRSLVWRVRVEAGVEMGKVGSGGGPQDALPDLKHRVALEAVIDLSTSRPRVVYLRDVTHLAVAARLADILPSTPDAQENDGEDASSASAGDPTAAKPPTGRVSRWSVPK